MNYNLAKQLKDAGFSQEYRGSIGQSDMILEREPKEGEGGNLDEMGIPYAYAPSLAELIEACEAGKGDEFYISICHTWEAGYQYHGYFEGWPAIKREADGYVDVDVKVEGSTPEEAVAKLWLALNKK